MMGSSHSKNNRSPYAYGPGGVYPRGPRGGPSPAFNGGRPRAPPESFAPIQSNFSLASPLCILGDLMANGMLPVTMMHISLIGWRESPAEVQAKIQKIVQETTPDLGRRFNTSRRPVINGNRYAMGGDSGNGSPSNLYAPGFRQPGGRLPPQPQYHGGNRMRVPPVGPNPVLSHTASSSRPSGEAKKATVEDECPESNECCEPVTKPKTVEKSHVLETDRETKTMLKAAGNCEIGFVWIKQSYGWRCAGGNHFVFKDREAGEGFARSLRPRVS
ncbi:MAG: hypothetical protein Q9170_005973 [Blastenia crenularia]